MKLTWLKLGAVPLAVLVSAAGATAVLAQDQSSSPSSAQSSSPAPEAEKEKKPVIEQRKENQQDRIAEGVKSGQLTPGETANLEKKEAAINKETRADRAANGGKLTPAEKAQVTNQQNQVSKQIYRDSTTPTPHTSATIKWASAVKTSKTASPRASRAAS